MNTLKNHLLLFLIPFTIFVMIGVFFLFGTHVFAEAGDLNDMKRYETVLVKSGDTLCSIADLYAEKNSHFSKIEYMESIISLNALDSEYIQAGQYILIPIYR